MRTPLSEHPTVKAFHAREPKAKVTHIDAARLRELCLECGADDAGFVAIGRPEIDDQREAILDVFPATKTLIAFLVKMQQEPVRSKFRSLANAEFHLTGDHISEVGHRLAARLEELGIGAMNEPIAFPMEVNRFPERPPWVISHKPIAEAAGLGKMGLHRNVIHPRFGSFILLGTLLIDAEVSEQSAPIDFNPCLDCKLCVAACPVGAIAEDGHFNFTACYTHNYREFLGGFTDWVALIADSRHAEDYRQRVTDAETMSQWQSLSFGPNYKAAYCLSVCPAGEDVIGPFLTNRKGHVQQVLRPLQEKDETVYVLPNSDAEAHVLRRFPQKTVKRVRSMTRPQTLAALWRLMPHAFQRGQSKGLSATYHFTFTGKESGQKTVIISDGTIAFCDGHVGTPNIRVVADSKAWLKVSNGQMNILRALATRKVRARGDLRVLKRFSACFPG